MIARLVVLLLALFQCLLASNSCPKNSIGQQNGQNLNQRIKLSIQPVCGNLEFTGFTNVNLGICLSQIKTIYTFGDSFTSNGNSYGAPPSPAVPNGTDPNYGGRASNGPTYPEYLAPGVLIKNYAVAGATVDRQLWLRRRDATDMVSHVATFLGQYNDIEQASTLAIVFYGINDMGSRDQGPGTLRDAAYVFLKQVELLIRSGLNKFIIISVPHDEKDSREYNDIIWQGMKQFRNSFLINFAYIDLMALWKPLYRTPTAFGFQTNSSCLLTSKTTVGGCSNPDERLFWTPGHPQTQTHRLMADWIKSVLNDCVQSTSQGATPPQEVPPPQEPGFPQWPQFAQGAPPPQGPQEAKLPQYDNTLIPWTSWR